MESHAHLLWGSGMNLQPHDNPPTRRRNVAVTISGDRAHVLLFPSLMGIEQELRLAGRRLILAPAARGWMKAAQPFDGLDGDDVEGIIALNDLDDAAVAAVCAAGRPTVWVDGPVYEPQSCIRRDEGAAGELIAATAIQAGYRRLILVALAGDETQHYSHRDRIVGVRAMAERAGVPVETMEIYHGADMAVTEAILETVDATTAIVCIDFPRLEWLINAGFGAGRCPGRDYGLLCCDDGPFLHDMLHPVARADFPRRDMGIQAARMLISLIENPSQPPTSQLVSPTLIRGSTAPGPPRRAVA